MCIYFSIYLHSKSMPLRLNSFARIRLLLAHKIPLYILHKHTGSLSIKSEIPIRLEISLQMARIITSNKQTFLADASGEISEREISTPTRPRRHTKREREIFQTFLSFAVFDLGRVPPTRTPPKCPTFSSQRHMWPSWPQHFKKIFHPSALVFPEFRSVRFAFLTTYP